MARPSNTSEVAERVVDEVAVRGLLLQSGKDFPSVTTIVCGEPVHGSWWSHPQSALIHWVLEALDDHPDLTTAKLVNGKVTIVHWTLWPALVAVGSARESWQMAKLTPLAEAVLREADRHPFRLSEFESSLAGRPSDAVRALERKLLIHTREVHTEHGKHSKCVRNWADFWSCEHRGPASLPSVAEAKATFEEASGGSHAKLPW